jgi:hypothetical protein
MTKKDYIKIADVLKNKYEAVKSWRNIEAQSLTLAYIEDFARMLNDDNPKFNRIKFYKFINKDFLTG